MDGMGPQTDGISTSRYHHFMKAHSCEWGLFSATRISATAAYAADGATDKDFSGWLLKMNDPVPMVPNVPVPLLFGNPSASFLCRINLASHRYLRRVRLHKILACA
jgi:hypothetical protein